MFFFVVVFISLAIILQNRPNTPSEDLWLVTPVYATLILTLKTGFILRSQPPPLPNTGSFTLPSQNKPSLPTSWR